MPLQLFRAGAKPPWTLLGRFAPTASTVCLNISDWNQPNLDHPPRWYHPSKAIACTSPPTIPRIGGGLRPHNRPAFPGDAFARRNPRPNCVEHETYKT